ncbi:MAG TPA: hypothetical protein VHA74_04055 [Candidatus Dojkabacteria bacterium]|nr:hypothetical protein [Candidatus Dojkabacteria bacterium]
MNKKIINVYKPLSLSSLDMIKRFQEKFPEYAQSTMSYAGRLDPMAHGVLILLVDEENLKRRDHEKGNKIYEFKILVGFSTDTYDILGMIDKSSTEKLTEKQIQEVIPMFTGKIMQSFPPYSAYRIKRRPLYIWASQNKLNEITIPKKEREILSLELIKIEQIDKSQLLKEITERLNNVTGEFRQKVILEQWHNLLKGQNDTMFQIVTMKSEVSSGTYVRQLVHDIGEELNLPMCVFEIYRTRSGEYSVEDSLRI